MRELMRLLGRRGVLRVESLRVEVVVQDAKLAYGNTRVLVSQVSGDREQWVDLSRVALTEEVER
jgi:hypothetical protein